MADERREGEEKGMSGGEGGYCCAVSSTLRYM